MTERRLKELFEKVKSGDMDVDSAVDRLRTLPYEDLEFAKVDNHRALRQRAPEVIYGEGKSPEQIVGIVDVLVKHGNDVLITRTSKEAYGSVKKKHRGAVFNEQARIIQIRKKRNAETNNGLVLVISAGTSDIPVAEEAALTAEFLGNRTKRLYDAGVAGVHRLLDNMKLIKSATVLIVVAGMEGALPSVVGGLVDKPVIAVPTSVGYGASFQGISALLGMLNSCASGVSVVNIDNGFGAGYIANLINGMCKTAEAAVPNTEFMEGTCPTS